MGRILIGRVLAAGTDSIRAFFRKPDDTVDLGDLANPVRVDPTGTTDQPITAAALPLPTGAATQATLGTLLLEASFNTRIGEVQAAPTANTVLGRLKDLLTGIVLAAGSAVIGKVRLVTATGDEVTDDVADSVKTIERIEPTAWAANVNSADATAGVLLKADGGAGTNLRVLSLSISVAATMAVTIQDEDATVLLGPIYLAANGGGVWSWNKSAPLTVATAKDLQFVTSAAGNVTVSASGYVTA